MTRTGRGPAGGRLAPTWWLFPVVAAKVGFVVSRAVGPAVVRNRVKRRLRELMRARLDSLPGGCMVVVRVHPAAAAARQADLAADLDPVLRRLLRGHAEASA